jgi:hypothetical protein
MMPDSAGARPQTRADSPPASTERDDERGRVHTDDLRVPALCPDDIHAAVGQHPHRPLSSRGVLPRAHKPGHQRERRRMLAVAHNLTLRPDIEFWPHPQISPIPQLPHPVRDRQLRRSPSAPVLERVSRTGRSGDAASGRCHLDR